MTELGHKGLPGVEGKFFKTRGISTQEQGYETSLGFYGGSVKKDDEGKVVFDMRAGLDKKVDTFDRFGDPRVRSIDEHTANAGLFLGRAARVWKNRATGLLETVKLKNKSDAKIKSEEAWKENKAKWEDKPAVQNIAPRSLLKLSAEGFGKGYALRYRGTPQEIAQNAERLGLSEYYGAHPWGIEIKKPEIYSEGTSLYDILVAEKEGKLPLQEVDHTQAFAESAKYVRSIHDKYGAIGELLTMDIQFQNREGSAVSNPVLGLPDIVWNSGTTMSETAQKATDIMDFLVNVSFWEHKTGATPEDIQTDLDTILTNYNDPQVIRAVRSFVNPERRSKKPTLPGESKLGILHNVARLGADKDFTTSVRQDVFGATEKYLENHRQQTSA